MRIDKALAPLILPLLAISCGSPAPPKSAPPVPPQATSGTARPSQPAPSRSRWQAVPARADGTPVPGGVRHIVKPGETGIAIARAYGVSWSRITEANRIARDSVLNVGQPLFIPTATAAAAAQRPPARPGSAPRPAATPEERAAAFQLDVDDLITGSAVAQSPAAPAAAPRPAVAPPSTLPALSWPVDGRVILSSFGPKEGGRVNDGISIKTLRGATVRAAADGQVIYVGDAIPGYGLMVLIRHGPPGPDAVVTAYGHLEAALAERGARVGRGQPIARAGSSGSASEPQLLFQLRQGRRAINPRPHLR